jgi:F-type H+-transporting ATPase subunit a
LGSLKIYSSLFVTIVFMGVGIFFLKGPLEIPTLVIEPIGEIFSIPIRSTVIQQQLAMVVILGLVFAGTRKMETVPGRVQALIEIIVEGLLGLCERAAGVANGRRFFPVVATIFLFILGSNWLGFIPGTGTVYKFVEAEYVLENLETENEHAHFFIVENETKNIPLGGFSYELGGEESKEFDIHTTSADFSTQKIELEEKGLSAGHLIPLLRPANTDVNTPLAIALWSFIFVEFWGITSLGLFSYMGKFFNFKKLLKGDIAFGLIDVFVGLIDLVSELVRLVSFTFRLFGNVFAGEILILMASYFVPLGLVMGVFVMEIFFGMIQAFIFSILTLIFGILAVTHHGGDEEHAS